MVIHRFLKLSVPVLSLSFVSTQLWAQQPASMAVERKQLLVLSLETAMDMAEKHSFVAKMATQDERSANAQNDAAVRSLLPQVSVGGVYLKSNGGQANQYPNGTTSVGTATVTQPLVGLFGSYLNVQQTAAQAKAAFYAKRKSQVDARFNGALAYINAQKSEELLKAAQSAVEAAASQLKTSQAKYDVGTLTQGDLLKVKYNLETAKASLIQAETTRKIAFLTLAEVIGIQNVDSFSLPFEDVSVWEQNKIEIPSSEPVLNRLTDARDDLRVAKENVSSAYYAKQQSKTSYLPSLNFIATYSHAFQTPAPVVGGVQVPATGSKSGVFYGLQLTWNVLDWGVRQAQIGSAAAMEQKAKDMLENTRSQARIDIAQSYLQLLNSRQLLESARAAVDYAQNEYKQMKSRFEQGNATTTDMILAANDRTNSLANLANARGAFDLSWISYQRSTGEKLTTQVP